MARFEHPHDRQMRRVPSRSGLLKRLRDVAVADEALDDWLGAVPHCDGLESRILDAVVNDAFLDEMLGDVAPAASLGASIRELVAHELLDDMQLDEQLRDVVATEPSHSEPGVARLILRPAPMTPAAVRRRGRNRMLGAMLATAAICLQVVFLHAIAKLSLPTSSARPTIQVADWGPLEVDVWFQPVGEALFVTPGIESPQATSHSPLVVELAEIGRPERGVVARLADTAKDVDLSFDVWSARIEHVGYPARESLPVTEISQIDVASPGAAMGHRGYDRAFHWRHGVSPWVKASLLPKQTLSLHGSGMDFHRVLDGFAESRFVGPEQIRVEDALSATTMVGPLPRAGALAIVASGGPSIGGELGTSMLQLTAAAGAPHGRHVTPAHVVAVVDMSSEMPASTLRQARYDIIATMRLMRPEDRLTIVALGGRPRVLCERMTVRDAEAVNRVLAEQPCEGIADWGRALPVAARIAMEQLAGGMRHELVILGSGVGEWADSAESWMDQIVSDAREEHVEVRACSLASEWDSRVYAWLQRQAIPQMTGSNAARRTLLEALTGQVTPVGRNVQLQMEFNPKAVAGYRVVGQDGSAGQWSETPEPIDMLAGEQRSSLVELRWAATEANLVGWADLSWIDTDGTLRRQRQRISRLQFASSFSQSAASLQQAMLFAEAAQVWSGSPFAAGREQRLQRLWDLQWECASEVRLAPETQRLLEALKPTANRPDETINPTN